LFINTNHVSTFKPKTNKFDSEKSSRLNSRLTLNNKRNLFLCRINCQEYADKRKSLRLPIDNNIDSTIASLQQCSTKTEILDFCFVNRDFLSYSLLSRLTSLKLKAQQDGLKEEQVSKIELILKNIIMANSCVDRSSYQSMISAEKIIKQLLEKQDEIYEINHEIKESKIRMSWFWIVLSAAIISWEGKLKEKQSGQETEVYEKLLNIKKKNFFKNIAIENLPVEIQYLESKLLGDNNFLNIEISPVELLQGLKLIISQLEKLPTTFYGPLLRIIKNEYDDIMKDNLGL
jgi:hypothetical protein